MTDLSTLLTAFYVKIDDGTGGTRCLGQTPSCSKDLDSSAWPWPKHFSATNSSGSEKSSSPSPEAPTALRTSTASPAPSTSRRDVLYNDETKGRRAPRRTTACDVHRSPAPAPDAAERGVRGRRDRLDRQGQRLHDAAGRPIEPRNLHRSFVRVSEAAGLRVVQLHDVRHGCATLLTAAGIAPRVVMEILGHSQITLTMDVCTHVVQDTQREAISHTDRLLKRRPRPA